MSAATPVEVVIPHWNRGALLSRALDSLEEQTLKPAICVVDNGSTDDTGAVLARHPSVRVVGLDRNHGFGFAVNRGVADSSADLVVFMNNDAVADPAFIEQLLTAREQTEAEMVAACLRAPDGTVESIGVELDQSLVTYDFMHGARYEEVAEADLTSPLGPCGGAAAYAREAFASVGGFDEAIFAYYEDVDLAVRMRIAGMRCAVAPRAFVWHQHSATVGARSSTKNEMLGWSRGYLRWKYGRQLSPGDRVRGFAIDAVVVGGKAVIDRNLGLLRGRLRARRELAARARPGDELGSLEDVPLIQLGLAAGLRRRAARRSL